MKKNLNFIFFLIFLASVPFYFKWTDPSKTPHYQLDFFINSLPPLISPSINFEKIQLPYAYNNKSVIPHTTYPIATFSSLDSKGVLQKYCLVNKVLNKKSSLLIFPKSGESSCLKKAEPILQLNSLQELTITQSKQQLKIFFKIFKLSPMAIKIPLYNLSSNFPKILKFNESSNSTEIISQISSTETTLPTGTPCHAFNNQCKETTPYMCQRCENGWYQVIGGSCTKGQNKFCGSIKCGEAGQFACFRGYQAQGQALFDDQCFKNSPIAYCNDDLIPICEGKNQLKCN